MEEGERTLKVCIASR